MAQVNKVQYYSKPGPLADVFWIEFDDGSAAHFSAAQLQALEVDIDWLKEVAQ